MLVSSTFLLVLIVPRVLWLDASSFTFVPADCIHFTWYSLAAVISPSLQHTVHRFVCRFRKTTSKQRTVCINQVMACLCTICTCWFWCPASISQTPCIMTVVLFCVTATFLRLVISCSHSWIVFPLLSTSFESRSVFKMELAFFHWPRHILVVAHFLYEDSSGWWLPQFDVRSTERGGCKYDVTWLGHGRERPKQTVAR